MEHSVDQTLNYSQPLPFKPENSPLSLRTVSPHITSWLYYPNYIIIIHRTISYQYVPYHPDFTCKVFPWQSVAHNRELSSFSAYSLAAHINTSHTKLDYAIPLFITAPNCSTLVKPDILPLYCLLMLITVISSVSGSERAFSHHQQTYHLYTAYSSKGRHPVQNHINNKFTHNSSDFA